MQNPWQEAIQAVVDLGSTVLVPAFWGDSILHSPLSQLAAQVKGHGQAWQVKAPSLGADMGGHGWGLQLLTHLSCQNQEPGVWVQEGHQRPRGEKTGWQVGPAAHE